MARRCAAARHRLVFPVPGGPWTKASLPEGTSFESTFVPPRARAEAAEHAGFCLGGQDYRVEGALQAPRRKNELLIGGAGEREREGEKERERERR